MNRFDLEADYALSLRIGEADDLKKLKRRFNWTGWRYRHWPADILRPGLRVYGFDPKSRMLEVLLEVTSGGAFPYSTLQTAPPLHRPASTARHSPSRTARVRGGSRT